MKKVCIFFLMASLAVVFCQEGLAQETYEVFRDKFKDAVVRDDYDEMKTLVAAANPDHVYIAFMEIARMYMYYSRRGDAVRMEEQLDMMSKLARVYKGVHGDTDYENYVKFIKEKDPEFLEKVRSSQEYYNHAISLYWEAAKKKTNEMWIKVEEKTMECLNIAKETGDLFFVGNAAHLIAITYANRPNKDYKKQAEFLKMALDAFMDFGSKKYKDKVNKDIGSLPKEGKAHLRKLRAQAAGETFPEGDAELAGGEEDGTGGESSGKFVSKWLDYRDLKYVKMKKYDQFETPSPLNWGEYVRWSRIVVSKDTPINFVDQQNNWLFTYTRYVTESLRFDWSKTPIARMKLVNRKNKIFLDPGNGEEQRLDVTTSFKPNTFEIDYGEGIKGNYTMFLREIGEETFLGIQRWTACDRTTSKAISFARGCYMEGTILAGDYETDLILIDDNNDGTYDNYGADALILGKPKKRNTSFLSKIIPVKDKFYALRVHQSGTSLRLREYGGPTGEVLIKYSKGKVKPSFLIIKGADGTDVDGCFFNCPNGKKIRVPVGDYSFHFGTIVKGKGRTASTAQIRRGKGNPFTVKENQLTNVKMGYPFVISGKPHRARTTMQLVGSEVKIHGKELGEEYSNFFPDILQPTYMIRKAKGGILQKEKKMRKPERTDYIQNGNTIWFPRDVVYESRGGGQGRIEVRFGGTHSLLGKLKGTWQ